MPPASLLIKPVSSLCNLRCKYCFYHSISENRQTESYGIMTCETLELLVKRAFDYAEQHCTFAFQGGEPTLTGIDFYKLLIELQKKYNSKGIKVQNAIQTNGIVIDDEWAEFFAANNFLVGISLDGPKDMHDENRYDSCQKGSFSRVMDAIRHFDKHGVEYNILCVVNAYNAKHIEKVYNYFRRNNFNYLQFIPCLDPLNELPGRHDFSLTPKRYSQFLKKIFDLWYADVKTGNMVSIRHLDNYAGMLLGYPPESCGMSGRCACYFIIEAGGQVYPCDFYVIDEWLLGNIREHSFASIAESTRAREFTGISLHVSPECKQCRFRSICRGGCRRNREPFAQGRPALNYYCSSYREFFEYAADRLVEIAGMLSPR